MCEDIPTTGCNGSKTNCGANYGNGEIIKENTPEFTPRNIHKSTKLEKGLATMAYIDTGLKHSILSKTD